MSLGGYLLAGALSSWINGRKEELASLKVGEFFYRRGNKVKKIQVSLFKSDIKPNESPEIAVAKKAMRLYKLTMRITIVSTMSILAPSLSALFFSKVVLPSLLAKFG